MAADPQSVEKARAAADTAARAAYGRLIAFLSARNRDVAAAEDALADAFIAALETWPERGIPERPEAWLLSVARRRTSPVASWPAAISSRATCVPMKPFAPRMSIFMLLFVDYLRSLLSMPRERSFR